MMVPDFLQHAEGPVIMRSNVQGHIKLQGMALAKRATDSKLCMVAIRISASMQLCKLPCKGRSLA